MNIYKTKSLVTNLDDKDNVNCNDHDLSRVTAHNQGGRPVDYSITKAWRSCILKYYLQPCKGFICSGSIQHQFIKSYCYILFRIPVKTTLVPAVSTAKLDLLIKASDVFVHKEALDCNANQHQHQHHRRCQQQQHRRLIVSCSFKNSHLTLQCSFNTFYPYDCSTNLVFSLSFYQFHCQQ